MLSLSGDWEMVRCTPQHSPSQGLMKLSSKALLMASLKRRVRSFGTIMAIPVPV